MGGEVHEEITIYFILIFRTDSEAHRASSELDSVGKSVWA